MNNTPRLSSLQNLPPSVEPTTEFVYPEDELPTEEETKRIESLAKQMAYKMAGEFINRLMSDLIKSKNPKGYLLALAYSSGISLDWMYDGNSKTMAGLARELNISRQAFTELVHRIEIIYKVRNYPGTRRKLSIN